MIIMMKKYKKYKYVYGNTYIYNIIRLYFLKNKKRREKRKKKNDVDDDDDNDDN